MQQPDGSISTTVTATECPLHSFNAGSNTLPCRRCPGGLITTATGSRTSRSCMAGPGYLFDKMVAKTCPRGTWKSTTSYATACTRCPRCLTTPTVGSIDPLNCSMAAPGCYVVTAGAAGASCPRNSYNMGYNEVTSCTPCEVQLVTLAAGAKSEGSCLAPPGVGYNAGSTASPKAAMCPINTYKSGFNRHSCSSCGPGFLSLEGSDSKQRCFVPIGHGTIKTAAADGVTSASGTEVLKCVNGTFGHPVDSHGIFELPCRPCQDGMTTWDAKPGVNAAGDLGLGWWLQPALFDVPLLFSLSALHDRPCHSRPHSPLLLLLVPTSSYCCRCYECRPGQLLHFAWLRLSEKGAGCEAM